MEKNKLIKKEDLTILDKIRLFFSNIFFRKKHSEPISTDSTITHIRNETKEFEERLKVDVDLNEEYKFKRICTEIENNPDKIKEVPDDELDKIIEHYEKIIDLNIKKLNEYSIKR